MSYLGIDLGTGGIRCLVVAENGRILSDLELPLENLNKSKVVGESEQDPREWIELLEKCLDKLFSVPRNREIKAISVDGTSGTVLPVSPSGKALGFALMHNDMRAIEEAMLCEEIFDGKCSPTFSLPKIYWMRKNLSLGRGVMFLHASDFLYSWLCASMEVPTDFTNGMKTGVDLEREEWRDHDLLHQINLPEVIAPGKKIGILSEKLTRRWGIGHEVVMVSGATDSNAAFYASGASEKGDWTSTIGSTLALKGLSLARLSDQKGRIYCHKHPDGMWLPGGASNGGGELVRENFSGREAEMEESLKNTEMKVEGLVYPSVRKGERMPMSNADFMPFNTLREKTEENLYLGILEGMAFIEKMSFELIGSLGGDTDGSVLAMGGTTKSAIGLQIRADLLQKTIFIPQSPNSAFGAAILAAAGHKGVSVGKMSKEMAKVERKIFPRAERRDYYLEKYRKFRSLCLAESKP